MILGGSSGDSRARTMHVFQLWMRRGWVDDAGTWTTALLGHFALRAPSRRVWRVDFGVMEGGVMAACCYPFGVLRRESG